MTAPTREATLCGDIGEPRVLRLLCEKCESESEVSAQVNNKIERQESLIRRATHLGSPVRIRRPNAPIAPEPAELWVKGSAWITINFECVVNPDPRITVRR